MRERLTGPAGEGGRIVTMKATGTKKRRRKGGKDAVGNKKMKGEEGLADTIVRDPTDDEQVPSESDDEVESARPRPKPTPIVVKKDPPPGRVAASSSPRESMPTDSPRRNNNLGDQSPSIQDPETSRRGNLRRNRLVISDEDEDD